MIALDFFRTCAVGLGQNIHARKLLDSFVEWSIVIRSHRDDLIPSFGIVRRSTLVGQFFQVGNGKGCPRVGEGEKPDHLRRRRIPFSDYRVVHIFGVSVVRLFQDNHSIHSVCSQSLVSDNENRENEENSGRQNHESAFPG